MLWLAWGTRSHPRCGPGDQLCCVSEWCSWQNACLRMCPLKTGVILIYLWAAMELMPRYYLGPSRPGTGGTLEVLIDGFQEHWQNCSLATQDSLGCVKMRVLRFRGSDLTVLSKSQRAAVLKLPPSRSLPMTRSFPWIRSRSWARSQSQTGSLPQTGLLPQTKSLLQTGSLPQIRSLP